MTSMIGQRLGSFLIEDKIGSGAMGEVYLARHEKSNRQAAVKVIASEFLQRENALNRFTREAKILEQLRHPNIVRYYARGRCQGIFYYAMEFVRGRDLDSLIGERGYLPWREVVDLAIQLCQALQYAHDHGVVHRDLKPSNLMITADSLVKLTDFGIAKDLEATEALTQTGRTLGTAAYMAPEQIRGTPAISHKTDLYALGCLLYQMLTGQPPFQGRSAVVLMHAHMSADPPRASFKNPEIPRALDDLVLKLMAKDPTERPWDAAAVAHQLEQIRDRADRGEPIRMAFDPAPAANTAQPDGTSIPSKESRRKKARAARTKAPRPPILTRQHVELSLLVLALLGLVGFLGYMFWPPSKEYLYGRAETMMASSNRSDWVRARDRYIDPLRRRFPEYQTEEVSGWLDQILKREAEDRSVFLTGSNPITNRAKNEAEELFKRAYQAAHPLEEQGQHLLAWQRWQEFLQQIRRRDDPEERGWWLFGQDLADDQLRKLQAQREEAVRDLDLAIQHWQKGRQGLAIAQFEAVIEKYQGAAVGDPVLIDLIDQAAEALEEIRNNADAPNSEADPAIDR